MRSVAVIAVVLSLLAGCSSMADKIDETKDWTASKFYSEAHDLLMDGAYDKAIKLFEKLESRFPYGRYAQQAQLETAYANYRQQETAQAIAACDRFIRLHPNHPNVDYVYYLKGLANFNGDLGLFGDLMQKDISERDAKAARDAFLAFKDLVTRYPESRYSVDATQRMKYLVNALASSEVNVARYYYTRGAYVAAVNRAQDAVKTYPEAPATEEGLFVLVKSYDALGLNDLRDDIERVMRKNFPKSRYYERGFEKDLPWWRFW
ncbi:MAG: outer membrane protein assembly factor BamD [Rhodocyclaceae bacterium]|nr:outer membrane protein assembly factor BamD [Rhodocyclaceae bacterium]